jgi:hypothetical protein
MGSSAITAKILNIAFSMTHTLTTATHRKVLPSSQLFESIYSRCDHYNSITIRQ